MRDKFYTSVLCIPLLFVIGVCAGCIALNTRLHIQFRFKLIKTYTKRLGEAKNLSYIYRVNMSYIFAM